MALDARHALMGALERERRVPVMIEFPRGRKGVHGVTGVAAPPVGPSVELVSVGRLVALRALPLLLLEQEFAVGTAAPDER